MKLYAIIKNNIIADAWMASSYEEAVQENKGATVIEVTEKNSPWKLYSRYEVKNA
jgi:hypothetical protein